MHRDCQPLVGTDQSLRVADLHAFVSKSAGTDQRQTQVGQEAHRRQKKAASKKAKQAAAAKKKAAANARANHQADKTPHKTRPELMAEMIALVAAWFPDRKFLLVVDSLYSGKSVLSKLPDNFDLIGPVHAKAALYAPAPPETKVRRGPRRKKGDRLKSAEAWEKDRTRLEDASLRPVRLAWFASREDANGTVLQSGQGSLAAFRAFARHRWRIDRRGSSTAPM